MYMYMYSKKVWLNDLNFGKFAKILASHFIGFSVVASAYASEF